MSDNLSQDNLIQIDRAELYNPEVDQALERARVLRKRLPVEAPPVSPLRRLLLTPTFYLPLAAALGALGAFALLEPYFFDHSVVGGQATLVTDRASMSEGAVEIEMPGLSFAAIRDATRLEKGADGQPPFASLDDIKPGTTLEATLLRAEREVPVAMAVRPASAARAAAAGTQLHTRTAAQYLYFPVTGTFICFMLLLAEGLSTRNWRRMVPRTLLGSLLACVFAFIAYMPAGGILLLSNMAVQADANIHKLSSALNMSPWPFTVMIVCRSAAWACISVAVGLGMSLVKGTRVQIRNAVLGGLIGGALGGFFFDPIDRFFRSTLFDQSSTSRLVGVLAVGLSVGFFVALVERLARDAWILVRSGPLAGKAFVLYRTPTSIGSSPQADIYLYKDAGMQPLHVLIHRIGQTFEIQAQGEAALTVGGESVMTRRLQSGDQLVVGNTLLQFEERARRPRTG